MSRARLRLIGWLGLVAFLVANPHTSTAIAACFAPPRQSPAVQLEPAGARRCCKHCANKARSRTPAPAKDRPSCPCCPKGPACPLPGGCAQCNVAKVPCPAPPAFHLAAVSLSGEGPSEAPPLYDPPFSGRLSRPPKA